MIAPAADAGRGDVGSVPGTVLPPVPGTANRTDVVVPMPRACACGAPIVRRGRVEQCAVYGLAHRHQPPPPLPVPTPTSRRRRSAPARCHIPTGGLSRVGHVSWGDLERWIIAYDPPEARLTAGGIWEHSVPRHVAVRCDVPAETVYRWRREGSLHRYVADVVAIELGVHPILIWPDWFEAVS